MSMFYIIDTHTMTRQVRQLSRMEHPNQSPNDTNDSSSEQAPAPDQPPRGQPDGPMQYFTRVSTWKVIGLNIISLGLYNTYWLFTRTQLINGLTKEKIPQSMGHTVIGLLLVNFIFSVMSEINPDNTGYRELASLSGLCFSLANLFWVFMLRQRIHRMTKAGEKSLFWLNGIYTFLFQVIYLQYKINEYIDEHTSESYLEV